MIQSANGAVLDLHYLQIDLLNLKSVRAAAQEFINLENRLDVLINNAGVGAVSCYFLLNSLLIFQIMTAPYKLTADKYETQWQTNYLAPHAFAASLMPLLLSTAAACGSKNRVRFINVSSDAAFMGPKSIEWDDVNMVSTKGMLELWYDPSDQGNSELSVCLIPPNLHDT